MKYVEDSKTSRKQEVLMILTIVWRVIYSSVKQWKAWEKEAESQELQILYDRIVAFQHFL